jgi:predicted nuclease of predicted toxin-antitoxin system
LQRLPRVLADENIPRDAKEWLVNKGFEVISVSQINLKSAKDHVIGNYAARNNLTIITLDKDFSQIYRTFKKDQLAVIIIRANPATPANIIETLNAAQEKIDLKAVKGKLVIITKRKIRVIT